jgi:hypothetical protein
MASDLENLLGSANMDASRKDSVIALLRSLDVPATIKRFLYARWARLVQVDVTTADLDSIARLG